MFERVPRLSDPVLGPFKNDKEARAAFGGALPPDLSLIAKARNVEYTGSVWGHPFSMLRDIVTSYQEGGADYLYALLTSYGDKAPAYKRVDGKLVEVAESEAGDGTGLERCATIIPGEEGKADICNVLQDGMSYNKAFPGHQIAMPQPISKETAIKYQDGSGSLEENARDLAAFLSWAADPSLNSRKYLGWQVMIYLIVTTVLLFIGKKRIWSAIAH
jgi:cytochrome c1